MQLWMNIYRSGWFHRQGKPFTVDRHAGDFYATREDALKEIDPPSHYIATIPFDYDEPDDELQPNDAASTPIPLSVSRREFRSKA